MEDSEGAEMKSALPFPSAHLQLTNETVVRRREEVLEREADRHAPFPLLRVTSKKETVLRESVVFCKAAMSGKTFEEAAPSIWTEERRRVPCSTDINEFTKDADWRRNKREETVR